MCCVVSVQILSTVLQCVIKARHSWAVAVIVIVSYQTALSVCGLNEYILSESTERSGLFSANREGIFSCCGYLSLFFAGVELGSYLFIPRSDVYCVVIIAIMQVGGLYICFVD